MKDKIYALIDFILILFFALRGLPQFISDAIKRNAAPGSCDPAPLRRVFGASKWMQNLRRFGELVINTIFVKQPNESNYVSRKFKIQVH